MCNKLFVLTTHAIILSVSAIVTYLSYNCILSLIEIDTNYPFVVFIVSQIPDTNNERICGGSLIKENWVLTAAHCIVDEETGRQIPNDLIQINIAKNQQFRSYFEQVVKVIPHEDYKRIPLSNDIALIKLKHPVPNNIAQPIQLSTETSDHDFGDQNALFIGWGDIETATEDYTFHERWIHLQKRKDCAYFQYKGDEQKYLCAEIENGLEHLATGWGDSGGPVMIRENGQLVQIGVVNAAVTLTGSNEIVKNDIYAAVPSYVEWIYETMISNT